MIFNLLQPLCVNFDFKRLSWLISLIFLDENLIEFNVFGTCFHKVIFNLLVNKAIMTNPNNNGKIMEQQQSKSIEIKSFSNYTLGIEVIKLSIKIIELK